MKATIEARVFCKDLQWRELDVFRSSEELVELIVKDEPSECRCERCVNMCRTVPCLGTPQEIARIMEAGHVGELAATQWAAGYVHGVPLIEMIQFRNTPAGCPMLKAGLCSLHAVGLKPLEGVRSTCGRRSFFHESATFAAALSWILPCNEALVAELFRTFFAKERSVA